MIFLWVLSWFSYGLFMKNQLNIINIVGAVISASLMVISYFLPSLAGFSIFKRIRIPQTSIFKRIRIPQTQKLHVPKKQHNLKSNKKILPLALATPAEIPTWVIHEKPSQVQIPSVDTQKQELQSSLLADKCEQPSESEEIALLDTQKQELQSSLLADKCEQPSESKEIASLDNQKQECQSSKLAVKIEQPSEPSGCPKNLTYFTIRPRPKQMPEECMTCANLIACACSHR
jgi:hypothetical protein